MARFRFEDLEIWQEAIAIADILFNIADELEQRKLFRFAEQLRGATMSISNNIAEGAGSTSKAEFRNFLNIAKRSTFETANIVFILKRRDLLDPTSSDALLDRLEVLCRRVTSFQKSLGK